MEIVMAIVQSYLARSKTRDAGILQIDLNDPRTVITHVSCNFGRGRLSYK